jgi:hypothetical protein
MPNSATKTMTQIDDHPLLCGKVSGDLDVVRVVLPFMTRCSSERVIADAGMLRRRGFGGLRIMPLRARAAASDATRRAEQECLFGELALVLRSVRPMKNETPDNAEPALQRDPDEWKTGDEPMTPAQRSYLETLCRDTGEEFDARLSKAEASKRIDELRARSPRLSRE